MNTFTEENYLKAIFHLSPGGESVSTNQIAASLNTRAASVTDMLKKLADKSLINYVPYQGVNLTPEGQKIAVQIIRKHRLWEYFLVEKLSFKWDEVHEVAEELEHISSIELVNRLDDFMGHPKFDPHGDPIPDRNGNIRANDLIPVSSLSDGDCGVVSGVRDHSVNYLKYLEKNCLTIGQHVKMIERNDYDHSVVLQLDNKRVQISREAANNLLIQQ